MKERECQHIKSFNLKSFLGGLGIAEVERAMKGKA